MLAGMISPEARSPGAAAVSGVRSMLPGGGTFREEMDRYTQAAAPNDSVMDSQHVRLPGETEFDAMTRFANSPSGERAIMGAASMAAPLVVHASPVKWAGQPTRAAAGTGEGGAAYGEGLYGSIPANAKGIDNRYRQQSAEPSVFFRGGDRPLGAGTGNFDTKVPGTTIAMDIADELIQGKSFEQAVADTRPLYEHHRKLAAKGNPDSTTRVEWYDAELSALDALKPEDFRVEAPPPMGSFHVWDVPDRMMDWDKPQSQQSLPIEPTAVVRVVMPDGREISAFKDRTASQAEKLIPMIREQFKKSYPDARYIIDTETPKGSDLVKQRGVEDLRKSGLTGHRYLGEAGSSGEARGIPNYVIYDDAAVKPLGTFASADEFLASDLYKQLEPRIKAEEADLVKLYPHLADYLASAKKPPK
jgi:hypothetical protein